MKYFIIALAIVTALASSCNRTNYKKQITEIDSLFVILGNTEAQLKSLDSAKVFEYQKNSVELLSNFDESVEDTLDLQTAVLVSDYAYVKKVLSKFKNEQKEEFEKDLIFSNKQLTRLKNDLEHNALPDDSVEYYLISEAKAVESLNKMVDKTVQNVNMQLERYDSLHPMVVNIANEFTSKVEAD